MRKKREMQGGGVHPTTIIMWLFLMYGLDGSRLIRAVDVVLSKWTIGESVTA